MIERPLFDIYEEVNSDKTFVGVRISDTDRQNREVIISGIEPDEVLSKIRQIAKKEPGLYSFIGPTKENGNQYGLIIETNNE